MLYIIIIIIIMIYIYIYIYIYIRIYMYISPREARRQQPSGVRRLRPPVRQPRGHHRDY